MLVSDVRTQVGDILGVETANTEVAARLLRWINNTRRELAKAHTWDFLRKEHQIVLPADITAGTVSVTANTVTGSGTSFNNTMLDSYMSFGTGGSNESEYYKITNVASTTSLTIDASYIGSPLSGSNYTIRRIYHRIPGDARRISEIYEYTYPRVVGIASGASFVACDTTFKSVVGTPLKYNIFGIYGREVTYTTGSVSGSEGSTTLTGASTAWMTNVVPGDKIEINGDDNDYNVNRVESDTQIVLYQKLSAAVAALTTYTATTDPDSLVIRFSSPTDRKALIPIEYYHYMYNLIGTSDTDEFMRRYGELIVEGCIVWEKRYSDDQSWASDYEKWRLSVRKTIASMRKPQTWTPNIWRYEPRGGSY